MERRKYVLCPEYCNRGSEGKIYTINDGLYKRFNINLSISKRKRKEEIILYLEKINSLKIYYPEIKYLVDSFLSLYIKGYVMEPIIGGSLSNNIYCIEEKLDILLQLKYILAEFRKYGLYYFDIRRPNIKIKDENHKPILLDIDGLVREGEKLDAIPYYISKYIKSGGKLDEHAQILMFNRFTQMCFQYNELKYDFDYDNTGKKIMADYKRMDSAYDNEYLCDHMKVKER